jgi:hypothetical protein
MYTFRGSAFLVSSASSLIQRSIRSIWRTRRLSNSPFRNPKEYEQAIKHLSHKSFAFAPSFWAC